MKNTKIIIEGPEAEEYMAYITNKKKSTPTKPERFEGEVFLSTAEADKIITRESKATLKRQAIAEAVTYTDKPIKAARQSISTNDYNCLLDLASKKCTYKTGLDSYITTMGYTRPYIMRKIKEDPKLCLVKGRNILANDIHTGSKIEPKQFYIRAVTK